MPSKRQPSKQRRAAQNRARTQALAARREAASQPVTTASSSSSSSSGASTGTRRSGGLLSGLLGGGGGSGSGGGLLGGGARGGTASPGAARTPSGRPPGTVALWIALGLGVMSFVLFALSQVPVDDRDEPLPQNGLRFQAVYLAARGILTGDQVQARDVSIFDAHGPAVVIFGLVPLAILAAAFIAFRRSPTSRPLTIGMLAMAVVVLLVGGYNFIFSLIFLAISSFQARRAEIPARMAERAAQREAEADDDEYLDEEEDDEDPYLDEDLDDEYLDEDDLDEDDLDDEEYVDEDEDLADDDDLDEPAALDQTEGTEEEIAAGEGQTATAGEKPARGRRKR